MRIKSSRCEAGEIEFVILSHGGALTSDGEIVDKENAPVIPYECFVSNPSQKFTFITWNSNTENESDHVFKIVYENPNDHEEHCLKQFRPIIKKPKEKMKSLLSSMKKVENEPIVEMKGDPILILTKHCTPENIDNDKDNSNSLLFEKFAQRMAIQPALYNAAKQNVNR